MNEQNLKQYGREKPPSTHEEAARNGRKGGKASGEARRQRKRMKQAAEAVLAMPLPKGKTREALKQLGVSESDMTYMTALVANMINSACDGDVGAAEFIRDLVEGSPAQEIRWEYLELRKLQFELRESQHENETWPTGKMSASFTAALQPVQSIQELFKNPQPNRDISNFE